MGTFAEEQAIQLTQLGWRKVDVVSLTDASGKRWRCNKRSCGSNLQNVLDLAAKKFACNGCGETYTVTSYVQLIVHDHCYVSTS